MPFFPTPPAIQCLEEKQERNHGDLSELREAAASSAGVALLMVSSTYRWKKPLSLPSLFLSLSLTSSASKLYKWKRKRELSDTSGVNSLLDWIKKSQSQSFQLSIQNQNNIIVVLSEQSINLFKE